MWCNVCDCVNIYQEYLREYLWEYLPRIFVWIFVKNICENIYKEYLPRIFVKIFVKNICQKYLWKYLPRCRAEFCPMNLLPPAHTTDKLEKLYEWKICKIHLGNIFWDDALNLFRGKCWHQSFCKYSLLPFEYCNPSLDIAPSKYLTSQDVLEVVRVT